MFRFRLYAILILGTTGLTTLRAAPNHAFFENRVRPILVEHCYECHSEKAGKRKGDLLLDRPSGWLEGGMSGPAVVPGDIENSLLSFAISHEDEDFAMPEEKLPEGKINVLNRWIQMGAPGPRQAVRETEFSRLGDQEYLGEKAKNHWSFQPVTRPALPPAKEGESGNPVDRFISRKLAEKDLSLSPAADRRTLLRRLSYDLTGLPPTPEEMKIFLEDEEPGAWARQVDRLLASPRFGERWGRYWLDIARYADTREWQAAGRDSRYPFAYTYRDYVIRAFNEDKPYDRFLREQIAADFYTEDRGDPRLAALGFLTVGSRFRNDQDEIANDRIDVVTRGIMGLTVACARCHDHKFDPIPTSDYYALHGVFRSVKDIDNYPIIDTGVDIDPEQIADYQEKRDQVSRDREKYKNGLAGKARKDFAKRPDLYLEALYDMSITRSADVRKLISGGKFSESVLTPIGKKVARIPIEKHYLRKPFWRPLATLVKTPAAKFPRAFEEFMADEKPVSEGGKIDPVVWNALRKEPVPRNGKALMKRYGEILKTALAAPEEAAHRDIVALVEKKSGEFHIDPGEAMSATAISGQGRKKIAEFDNAVRNLDAEHPAAPPRAMVVEEATLWNARIYNRGDRANRGDPVNRRFLTAMGGEDFSETHSGRKDLAEAIASPDNPFTTRAAADRIWRYLMGKSLIPTPGDMGLQCDPPSHPELLDFLASTFVERDWSTKSLIRLIVLSSTYRQSGEFRSDAAEVDPENQLYWRRELRRLDFEAMRDSVLAAAGNLDLTMGGRAVEITAPPYTNRRTVYAHIDRVNLDDLFATFDFPSPLQSSTERPETLVPQQALFGMNDGFVISQARRMTRGLAGIKEGKVRQERINHLYQQVFQRDATPEERRLASAFLDRAREGQEIDEAAGWQYGFGSPDPELAADERFTAFPFYDPERQSYRFAKAFPHPKMRYLDVDAPGGHTGRNPDESPVRRWTAPYAARFEIRSEIRHLSEKGDGIRGRILSSRKGLLGEVTAFHETKDITLPAVNLEKGEILDFVVDCRENPNSDRYHHHITITKIREGDMYDDPRLITTWDSRSDFAGPPPPPLNAWEQLAHGLFMTNEFLFVE